MKYLFLFLSLSTLAFADLISITPAQKLHQQINIQSTNLWNQLTNADKQMFMAIWHNPDKNNLTPCQAFAALGTDAVAVRASHGSLSEFMNSIIPGSNSLVEDSTYTLVNNSDGSVTCTPPVTPSPSPSPSAHKSAAHGKPARFWTSAWCPPSDSPRFPRCLAFVNSGRTS